MILCMENMKMPNIKKTVEITFSTEDLEQILIDYLDKNYNMVGESDFTFKVVNRPYPCGAYNDLCDRHEFDCVKVVMKNV